MRMFRIGSVQDKCPLAVEMLSLAIQRARALCGAICYDVLYFALLYFTLL